MSQESWERRATRITAGEVRRYREKRGLSAQQLADKCEERGFPIPRSVLANLENGRREAISVAELLVLAAALEVAPIRLLFPMGLAETVEVLPGSDEDTLDAAAWVIGKGDADVELLMTHRDLVRRAPGGGKGPSPLGIFVGSMTEEDVKRWQQDVTGEKWLRQTRRSIREHGLTPPPLPDDLTWIDDQEVTMTAATTEEPMTEPATTPEPQPVVAVIVTSPLGVLVGRRNDGKPPWTFIAGEIEPKESPAHAGVREVKEETGLAVAAGPEIGRRVHPKTGRTMIYMAAVPEGSTDVFVGDEEELAEVRWVGLVEADELLPGMYEPVRAYLAQVLRESAG